jgi:thiol:disulfide interchange protein
MQRLLRWFPLAWAAGAYFVLLWLPTYSQVSDTMSTDGTEIRTAGHATLVAVNGPRVYLILAVPVLAAALAALPWPARLRRPAAIAGAVIAGVFVVLGMMSVGMFFLPSAIGLIALAQATGSTSRLSGRRDR